MGPKTARLVGLLERLAPLLSNHWREWIEKDLAEIRAGDFYGVEHFLSAFGGMGSINDRLPDDAASALLTEARAVAEEVRHESR